MIGDKSVQSPQPGVVRLSPEAVDGRLRRVFAPNAKGEFKVSQEIVAQWKTRKGRKSLAQLFQTCGFNSDWGWDIKKRRTSLLSPNRCWNHRRITGLKSSPNGFCHGGDLDGSL